MGRPEIADLDPNSARHDQRLFKLTAWLAGFKLDDEALARAGPGCKLGLRPATRLAFSLTAAPKSRADLNIEHLLICLTVQED